MVKEHLHGRHLVKRKLLQSHGLHSVLVRGEFRVVLPDGVGQHALFVHVAVDETHEVSFVAVGPDARCGGGNEAVPLLGDELRALVGVIIAHGVQDDGPLDLNALFQIFGIEVPKKDYL